jgi:DNA-binding HxlR family transcriptional regulator
MEASMATTPRCGPYICGIDAAMDVVSGKWKSLILWELDNYGTRRFGELKRGLVGVSEKMLIQHLREMEEDGLIHREVYRQVPPKVEYSLTEHGHTLNEALRPLGAWGTKRLKRLEVAAR